MPQLYVEIDAAPAYELVLTLCVAADVAGRETYEEGRAWLDRARAAHPQLVTSVERFSGGSDLIWAHLLSIAYACPPPRDVPALLKAVETMEPLELRLRLLGYYVRYFRRAAPPELIASAAEGDGEATRQLLTTAYGRDDAWQGALAALLPLSVEETKGRLLALLRRWHTQVFEPEEGTLMAAVRWEAESAAARTAGLFPIQTVETLLPGHEGFVPEPGIRRVVLIPSAVVRPHIHSFDHGEVQFLVYGVSDESLVTEPDAPSPRLVRLAKAVGDERRLRILKRLTTGQYTLQELSEHFGTGNTTMLYHLVILRAAGLVRLHASTPKRYILRREALADLSGLLERFLA